MNVKWVGQEDAEGCGLACLAMAMGQTYQEAKSHFGVDFAQAKRSAEWDALIAREFKMDRITMISKPQEPWPCPPFADLHVCEVLVREDLPHAHMVVMLADGMVLDPLTPEPKHLDAYATVFFITGLTRL